MKRLPTLLQMKQMVSSRTKTCIHQTCVGTTQRPTDAPSSYVVRDEANGFKPNEDLYPSDNVGRAQLEQVVSEDPATRPKVPQYIIAKGGNEVKKNDPIFPLDIVDGVQHDEGDFHRVKVPPQRLSEDQTCVLERHCWREGSKAVHTPFCVSGPGGRGGFGDESCGWLVED
jgi:hypothetical protein